MLPRSPQYPGPAWNGNQGNIYVDGLNGSHAYLDGDSPDGQLNLGQGQPQGQLQRPFGPQDVRGVLQAVLAQQAGQGVQRPHNFANAGQANPRFSSDARFQGQSFQGLGPAQGQQMPWDTHHGMISAAGQLARMLAQQHTAGLRRFQ